jgi:uncharacterized membrane protein YqjE
MVEADDTFEQNDPSLGGLVKVLSTQISTLVRQEIALARAEMAAKAKGIGLAAAALIVAAVLAFLAAGVLSACFVLAIAPALPGWLAALIVAAAYLLVAGILVLIGVGSVKRTGKPVPKHTIETVKEGASWARHPTRSAER